MRIHAPIACLALLCAAAVSPDARAAPGHDPHVAAELAALRSATAAFHRLERAAEAGWSDEITGCLSSPDGAMGYHYMNFGELLDGGTVDPLRPEALVYAPDATGAPRLVAVEYVILESDLPATAPAPELFGQPFHFNPAFGVWALHAWVWKHNPAGMFADWNPRVSCD